MRKLKTDDAEPVTKAKAPPLNRGIKELDMTKLIKLFTLAVLWLASLLPAAAEIDLFEIKAALVLGKTTIIVPAEAKEEDLAAIKDCIKDAQDITLDLSATAIKDLGDVFRNCKAINSVILPKTLTIIADSAFYGCDLRSVEIPASVTSIGDSVFYGCERLTSIEIPASVTSIGDSAFYGCESLTLIKIPASVTSIGAGAFSSCGSLTKIDVAIGNKNYASADGVLFSIDKATLVCFPEGKTADYYPLCQDSCRKEKIIAQ